MAQNPNLAALSAAGVSVWLDDLSRDRLQSGNLKELIDTRSVVGVTTNPSIFQAALSKGTAYDAQVAELAERGADVDATIRTVTTDDVRNACDVLRPQWESSNGIDGRVSIEVDPRVTTRQHMEVLAEHGFNRISLGVQDFTPKVQEAIERIQSVEQTRAIVEAARELGFGGVNVDLIYGLPYQQSETFEQTVEEVLALGVDRSAVYSFAFVPWIRGHQKTLDPEDLPDAATKLDLFALARERFLRAGYEPIGMDHFARPDDELARAKREGRLRRNFQGYTVVAGDTVVGLGVSSIGDVEGGYFQNEKKLPAWRTAVESGQLPVYRGVIASPDDLLRRHVIQELMCNTRVDVRDVEKRFDIDFRTTFAEDLARLAPLVEEGLAHVDATEVRATPLGTMFLRNLAMCFDRYWRERHEGGDKPVFSRTV